MLSSVGSLAKPINSTYVLDLLSHKFAAFPLINPTKPLLTTIHSVSSFSQGRRELAIYAKKSSGRANEEVLDMDGSDEDYDEDEDEDEGEFVPFPNMSRWFQNKPSGFGEGREYDTEIEDKLFEEILQSRRAQLANINKLKHGTPLKGGSQKELQLKKDAAAEAVSGATRVRVSNLPKKRNIHKDLQLAFKGFPGILNISPVVSANKKTRDPICKGFAFVDLAYEEDAKRSALILGQNHIFLLITRVTTNNSASDIRSHWCNRSIASSTPISWTLFIITLVSVGIHPEGVKFVNHRIKALVYTSKLLIEICFQGSDYCLLSLHFGSQGFNILNGVRDATTSTGHR